MLNRIPTILAGLYCGLFLLSIVPIFTGEDALSGIFAVVLGLPWTMILSRIADAINPSLTDGLQLGLAIVLIAGLINGSMIYLVSRWIVRQIQGR